MPQLIKGVYDLSILLRAMSNLGLEVGKRGVRMVDSLSSFLTTSFTYNLVSPTPLTLDFQNWHCP